MSNLDATTLRLVRKGVLVTKDGQTAEAQSLRARIKTLEAAKLYASAEALRQRLRALLNGEDFQ